MNSFVKTPQEIQIMKEGGVKLGNILHELLDMVKPGVKLSSLEQSAQELIKKSGGFPSFQTVEGYKWATCLCVNEAVVHGIPTEYSLVDGDVLTVDVGLLYKGMHTDTAWTIEVQSSKLKTQSKTEKEREKERFLKVGEEALWKAIAQAHLGNRIGHISYAIQSTIEKAGFSVVRTLVGHGVGYELHEAPHVPGMLKSSIEKTLELLPGMTIAIEVIYAMGSGDVVYDSDDGWTIATRDRSLSAVFEHTVLISDKEPIILTRADKQDTIGS